MLTLAWLIAAAVLVAALAGATFQAASAAADARRLPPLGRLVEVGGGHRLHARCSGSGQPAVVLEAGIAASSMSWTLVQPRIAEFTRVCAYDRAGLGWSDAAGSAVTAADNAEALHAMLRALGIPPPYVLVGHSYGNFVIRLFAARHPHEVGGMVLVDPIPPSEWATPTADDLRRLRGAIFLSRVGGLLAGIGFVRLCLQLLASGSPAVPRRVSRLFGSEAAGVLGRLVGEVQKLPPDTWPIVRAFWSRPKCFAGMARHLAGLPRSARDADACGGLGDIPLIVISAGRQKEASRLEQERLTGLSSRGRQIIAKGSGHWIHLDEPDIVVSAIREVVTVARF
jgi:pimeloyl-ACP methyl ester carboxylesterase